VHATLFYRAESHRTARQGTPRVDHKLHCASFLLLFQILLFCSVPSVFPACLPLSPCAAAAEGLLVGTPPIVPVLLVKPLFPIISHKLIITLWLIIGKSGFTKSTALYCCAAAAAGMMHTKRTPFMRGGPQSQEVEQSRRTQVRPRSSLQATFAYVHAHRGQLACVISR
jgi:hypothetical protein